MESVNLKVGQRCRLTPGAWGVVAIAEVELVVVAPDADGRVVFRRVDNGLYGVAQANRLEPLPIRLTVEWAPDGVSDRRPRLSGMMPTPSNAYGRWVVVE